MNNEAMLWEDYIKVRNAKKGESVVLSDGHSFIKGGDDCKVGRSHKPSKNYNLDAYDDTYV